MVKRIVQVEAFLFLELSPEAQKNAVRRYISDIKSMCPQTNETYRHGLIVNDYIFTLEGELLPEPQYLKEV